METIDIRPSTPDRLVGQRYPTHRHSVLQREHCRCHQYGSKCPGRASARMAPGRGRFGLLSRSERPGLGRGVPRMGGVDSSQCFVVDHPPQPPGLGRIWSLSGCVVRRPGHGTAPKPRALQLGYVRGRALLSTRSGSPAAGGLRVTPLTRLSALMTSLMDEPDRASVGLGPAPRAQPTGRSTPRNPAYRGPSSVGLHHECPAHVGP